MPLFGTHGAWQGQERLGAAARRAVQRAEAEAAARGLHAATPDLLLLALLAEGDGVPNRALVAAGVEVAGVRDILGALTVADEATLGDRAPLDEAAREGVILGINEARRGGFEQAGAGHLLLGVLEARSGRAARWLARHGARIAELRGLVHDLELAGSDRGAALFARAFAALLDQIGGARACPHCHVAMHASFNACYNCGAEVESWTE